MASRKQRAPRKTRATALDPTPRHLWLASLGVLVVARRGSGAAVSRALRKLEDSLADTRFALRRAEADLRAGLEGVRSQVEPRVQRFGSDVEARLAPLVAKLGLTATVPSKRRARGKPKARATRKAAR